MMRPNLEVSRELLERHVAPAVRRVLAALPGAVLAARGLGPIVYANAAAERLLGAEPRALEGVSLGTVVPRLPLPIANGARAADSLAGRTLRASARRIDGVELEVEVSFGALEEAGDPLLLATVRETRDRHELEEQLSLSRHMRAATHAAAQLTARLDATHAAETIVNVLARDFGAAFAQVWTVEDCALVPRARAGTCDEPPGLHAGPLPLEARSPVAAAARSRTPLVRNGPLGDLSLDAGWLEREGIQSAAVLPLAIGGEVRGVVACVFRAMLDNELVEVLFTLSAITAAVFNDIALLSRAQAAREEAESAQRWIAFEREAAEARAAELKAANSELEHQRDELEAVRRRLTAQHAVLKALAGSDSLEQAAPRILEAIGTSMDWAVGALWVHDSADGELVPAHVWQAPGVDAAGFVERTRRTRYALGEGMVGRVWQAGEPAWLDDAPRSVGFRRGELAAADGLLGAIWFPLRHGNTVFGVVEFFRRDRLPPDEETLRAIAALGNQIGQFVERVRAQRAVRDGEDRLETTLRSIGDAVITTDTAGRVDFMNPVAEALTGWRLEEARGRNLDEVFRIVSEATRAPVESPVDKVMREGLVLGFANHTLLISRGGAELLIDDSGAPIRDSNGGLLGVVLVFRNVTEKRRAEKRRRFIAEASALLSTSLDWEMTLSNVAQLAAAGPADWCTVDLLEPDGSVRSLAVAHGDPQKLELAQQLRRRYPPDPRSAQGIGRVLHTGESELFPEMTPAMLAALACDPEHFELLQQVGLRSAIVVPLAARGRTFGAILMAGSDASRRFNADDLAMAEELARRASLAIDNARLLVETREALHARDEFLSIASHELKTPLTSLQLQVQSLLRAGHAGASVSDPRFLAKLETADRQVGRLAELVHDLLDVSRITDGRLRLEPEEVCLAAIVQDVAARFAGQLSRNGCRLEIKATGETNGHWDRVRIEQVVVNLVSNAIKYGPGRPIEIAIEGGPTRTTLTVTDHGIGIAPNDIERIFARFERAVSSRHYGGLGVGLYIVRRVLDAMGGSIAVDSRPGEGASFRVTLPRIPAAAEQP